MQLGNNDMRLTYGEGVALLGVERRLSDDEAGHSSWHYIVRFCRRAVADTEGDGEGTDGGEVGAETPPGGSSLPINTEDGDDGAGGGDDGAETPIGGSSAPMNEQPPIRRRLTSKTPRAATVYPETPSASAAAASSDRPLPYHDAAAEIMRENSAIGERQLLSALQERGFAISRASAREWLRSYKQSAACDDSLTAQRRDALLQLLAETPDLSEREAGRLLRARGISIPDAELRSMLRELRPRAMADLATDDEVEQSGACPTAAERDAMSFILQARPTIQARSMHDRLRSRMLTSLTRRDIAEWLSGNREAIVAEVPVVDCPQPRDYEAVQRSNLIDNFLF